MQEIKLIMKEAKIDDSNSHLRSEDVTITKKANNARRRVLVAKNNRQRRFK